MDDNIFNYFKEFLDEEDLETFLTHRIFAREVILDDPIDFINGFNLALAFVYRMKFNDYNEEAKFRISIALWLRRYIDSMEKLDWR